MSTTISPLIHDIDFLFQFRDLSTETFQLLVNYSSCRCRAIITCLLTKMAMFTPKELDDFKRKLGMEIVSGSFLLGLGSMLHLDRLHSPYILRQATKLITNNRTLDFDALVNITSTNYDGEDVLLAAYSGNWWSDFPREASTILPTPRSIYEWFQAQAPGMPRTVLMPPYDILNLSHVTAEEPDEAYDSATQAMKDIESDIKHSSLQISRAVRSIAVIDAAIQDFKDAENRALVAKGKAPIHRSALHLQGEPVQTQA
ncbi:hypothetical protein DFP72DRAFT_857453 [Ephemerocybe angulata]|uniref:Uncharacterized protein n=1 Tax=Ephemerocybe angulata TaxID=980116 RepID=A0A8H6HDU8_9AGAR|nr:hypothetical protein DFP72DRAFT_857453 [Tulosesus angulatus]